MKFCMLILTLCICGICSAQNPDSVFFSLRENVQITAYIELYAAVDDDDNNKHQRPYFLYNNTRTGELALNLGIVKAAWANKRMRGNVALMTGTYAERNLATESKVFQHVYESNVGLKLSSKKEVWLDMGILNSHIGLESAIGKDNPTLTRSICAENSPYYETGIKLSSRSTSEKWNLAFLVMNGWQRIYKLDGNYYPALGMQVNFKPNEKLQLNYSNYFGDESPDEDFGPRFFNDFYIVYAPSKKLSFQGAFDAGIQPDFSDDKWPMQYWYGWFGIVRVGLTDKLFIAGRVEQYNDPGEIIVSNNYDDGLVTLGYSFNVDYAFYQDVLLRLEARRFEGKGDTFENRNGDSQKTYNGLTACLSVAF